MNTHHAVSTNTHRNIIVIILHIKKKKKKISPTVHPEPPYCSGFGCKTYKDCFLTRQIHLLCSIFFFFFFCLFFPFFFFFFFFFFQRGVGLFTDSELGMTWHIFLCICYIICCLEFSICCPSHPTQQGPLLPRRSPPVRLRWAPSGMDGEAAYYSW